MTQRRSILGLKAMQVGAALTLPLLAASPVFAGWGPSAFYPSSVAPSMPESDQAQQLRSGMGGLMNKIRDAHWQSTRRGWASNPARPGHDPARAGPTTSVPVNPDR